MEHSEDDTEGTLGDIDDGDEKVVINVGGIRHETLVSSLSSKQGTRLAQLAARHLKGRKEEYFFDRHPGVFSTVMDFYRSGDLHVPLDICGAVVKRELDYWKIDGSLIEPCCWTSYSSYIDKQKTLSDFNRSVVMENEKLEAMRNITGWKNKQMVIWMILDHPRSSRLAMAYAVTSFLFVLASIAGFCVETLPIMFSVKNVTRQCGPGRFNETVETMVSAPFLTHLDYICTAFFTIELLVRILFAPAKLAFFRSFMNIIDILALMPLYVQIVLDLTDSYYCLKNDRAVLETIFVLRIIRIFRIFHLVKHYKALKILVHAIKASIHELLMLSIFLFIAMLVFSTLIFYAERSSDFEHTDQSQFGTIPIGFWWSIVTMTTVGYGDIHPTTPMGYAIGAMCALAGLLLVALTIPVISNNFALFYMHARTRADITENKFPDTNEESTKNKSKLPLDSSVRRTGAKGLMDSRALLSNDSNSTTDESGIMMNTRNPDATPSHDRREPEVVRVPIPNINETVM